jgi:hypothetical protein
MSGNFLVTRNSEDFVSSWAPVEKNRGKTNQRQLKKIRKFKSGAGCKSIVSTLIWRPIHAACGDLIFSDFFSLGSV